MQDFVHLHVHTYYSILDGQSSVQKLVDKVVVLVGKNTLSIIQRNIVHKAPPS